MRWLQSVFANRFNRFRKERGHLFQGRFESLLVGDWDRLAWLCHYIDLNPARAGVCGIGGLKGYAFSSYWHLRSNPWLGSRLNMGAAATISRCCGELGKGRRPVARALFEELESKSNV